ncbi:Aste57867_13840 [Aphanomyces stellatus]|uniref:Aste57867_13840 protein n=1 Tax=Aphanomyces stellatus TaxID=120398 RepID=A0A485KZ45_9STRA|nr:hypothetical protein As57867_013789 [Aphanomyces stellatus]VFT90672.1 Aste57867_13840 [Aphanomyces stellatus]
MELDDAASKVLAAVERILCRREYFRKKQRQYRRKNFDERTILLQEIAALEAQIRTSTPSDTSTLQSSDGILSWQVVAQVFRADTRRAKGAHKDLTEQTVATCTRIDGIIRFLHQCRPSPVSL